MLRRFAHFRASTYPTRSTDRRSAPASAAVRPRFTAHSFARRRGISTLMVLALISITLALSYALLRSQTISVRIQSNVQRLADARAAAEAGVLIGFRRMQQAGWAGVAVPFREQLDEHQWCEVGYVVGDAELLASGGDLTEYPYRVTIRSTGYASDPQAPEVRNQYTASAVVQLVRKQLAPEPAGWPHMLEHTLYQWTGSHVQVQPPFRVEGRVRLQGPLKLYPSYPSDPYALGRYAYDLERMRANNRGDYRPFSGPLVMPRSINDGNMLTLLDSFLRVPVWDTAVYRVAAVEHPGDVVTYRLYPGGPEYAAKQVSGLLENVRLAPDVETNPLGLVRATADLELGNNVQIEGVLLTQASGTKLRVNGQNVTVQGAKLPPREGSAETDQMPAAIVSDDVEVGGGVQAVWDGLLFVGDKLVFKQGPSTASFQAQSRMHVGELVVEERNDWPTDKNWWSDLFGLFDTLLGLVFEPLFFPEYVRQQAGLRYDPELEIKPPAADIRYHWQDWSQPVYLPHPDEDGLSWQLIRWQ